MVITDLNKREDRKLLPEQEDAVQFMLHRTSAIVSLMTGLGKTFSSLTAMQHLKDVLKENLLTIILAPTNAVISFDRELKDFGYSNECEKEYDDDGDIILEKKVNLKKIGYLLASNQDTLHNETQCDDIIIVSYSKLGDYFDDLSTIVDKFRSNNPKGKILLIIDEAHTLSNNKTARTKTALGLRKAVDICWALTATPIKNSYEMVYHICNFIRPKFIAKSFAEFTRNFCETQKVQIHARGGRRIWVDEIIGRKNEETLKELLEDLIIFREINYNLKYHYIEINLKENELEMYDEVASAKLSGGKEQFSNRVIDLQKLLDNSLSVDVFDEDEFPVFTKDYKFDSKENKLIETLEKLISKKQTPIIYTDFVDTLDRLYIILSEKGYTVHKIDGRTNTKKRKEVEDNLKVGDITIITSAGTASLNLQKANVMIFYNVPFSSVNVIQSIGRITRLGSSYSKQHVIFLHCVGTIDEYKIRYFKSNASMISSLLGSSSNLPDDLVEADAELMKEMRNELLWQYKSKKNGIRRVRRANIRDRLIISSIDSTSYDSQVLNISGHDLELELQGNPRLSKCRLQEDFSSLMEHVGNQGYFKSKLRDYLRYDYSKIRKIYYLLTRESRIVYIIDGEHKIGKLIKDFLLENWRYFEGKL
ncbi:MAG: SNF2-related protein [Cetobacterium sp.]